MVSAPLAVRSRYATVWSSRTANDPATPFGDTLTCPSGLLGAVATKNTGCARTNSRSRPSIRSCTFPIGPA